MEIQDNGSNVNGNEQNGLILGGALGRKDELTLSVSHENLTQSLCSLSKKGLEDRIKIMGPNGEAKKTKEKPLKEITNKLVSQPINLKPNWVGLRQSLEKFKGNVEEQLNLCAQVGSDRGPNLFNLQSRPTTVSANSSTVKQHEPRPPGLTHLTTNKIIERSPNALNHAPSSAEVRNHEGQGAAATMVGRDDLMQEESLSDCQSEEAMVIATPSIDS